MNQALHTLTDFEVAGLKSVCCLADGHAYQDIHPTFEKIVHALPEIWLDAEKISIPEAEKRFNEIYATFINSPILRDYPHFRICPTASNTIDIIGAVLKCLQVGVVMVEPTFDNLSLLLRRRQVPLIAINDKQLFNAAESDSLEAVFVELKCVGALFLVNPNNPTGCTLSEVAFKNIVAFCEKHNILLIIDNCFRVYNQDPFDDYQCLINSSVRFIAFEDTGKVWPTQDLKASLVYFSKDLAEIFNEIYNEVFLCVSNFSLGSLSNFFIETAITGIKQAIWDIVDERRTLLRKTLSKSNSLFQVSLTSTHSNLPVEWVEINHPGKHDLQICNELRQHHLAVLPGRQFFWDAYDYPRNQKYIRISLMKKKATFLKGMATLEVYFDQSRFCNSQARHPERGEGSL